MSSLAALQSVGNASVRADIAIDRASSSQDQAAIRRAAQEFESILIRQMLQTMRDSSINPYREQTSDAYLALGDDQFAKIVSASGGFGFGHAMAEQLIWQIDQARQLSGKP